LRTSTAIGIVLSACALMLALLSIGLIEAHNRVHYDRMPASAAPGAGQIVYIIVTATPELGATLIPVPTISFPTPTLTPSVALDALERAPGAAATPQVFRATVLHESAPESLSAPLEPTARGDVVARWTDADVRDALSDASLMVQRIIYCEVGRSGAYDPYAVGSLGEIGPAQLLPGSGNGLAIFYRWGFVDPNSPYEARAFIERVITERMLGSQYPRTSQGCAGSV
jgi:hypothetical protein